MNFISINHQIVISNIKKQLVVAEWAVQEVFQETVIALSGVGVVFSLVGNSFVGTLRAHMRQDLLGYIDIMIMTARAGVIVDERGIVAVDKQMRTNVPHMFAIGDVPGQPMLAHTATHEGKVAAEVAAGLKSGFDARVIPSVAYTIPEVAWVGLTETAAKENNIEYEKGKFPWASVCAEEVQYN